MSNLTEAMVTIFTAIVGVAIVAVLISRKSNTAGVLQAFGSMFGNSLAVAVSPVTGANTPINLSYPNSGGGFGGLGGGLSFNGFNGMSGGLSFG